MSTSKITSIVHEGDRIPFDGVIVGGVALVEESAYSGVSKPGLLDNILDAIMLSPVGSWSKAGSKL